MKLNLNTPKWIKCGSLALLIWLPHSYKRFGFKFPKHAGNAQGWSASRWFWRVYRDIGVRDVGYRRKEGLISLQ